MSACFPTSSEPVSQLVYSASRRQVRHVWVAGRQLLRDGEPTTLDSREICAKAAEWGRRIAQGLRR